MHAFRTLTVAGIIGAVLTLSAGVASAHVTANPATAPAGGYGRVDFRVPHGCDGEPTNTVEVKIPVGVVSLKPLAKPGWTVETEMVDTEPYELHGQTLTSQIGVVRWTGGSLADSQFDDFAISAKFPDSAGETLYFPTIQYCGGKTAEWLDIPVSGGAEPEHPAPAVLLVGNDEKAPATGDTAGAADAERRIADLEAKVATLSSSGGSDRSSNTLSVIALIAGIAGVGVAGVALVRKR